MTTKSLYFFSKNDALMFVQPYHHIFTTLLNYSFYLYNNSIQ